MQAGVGVRVAHKALVVRDLHTAEPDPVARPEPVGVEALADSDRAGLARQRFGHGEILRIGKLHQHGIARNGNDPPARALDGRRVVRRRLRPVPGRIGADEHRVPECLGSLHAIEAVARHGGKAGLDAVPLQGVSHGQHRHGAVGVAEGRQQRGHMPRGHEGPGGVVHQHRRRRCVGQALEPEPDRVGAVRAATQHPHLG